MSREKGSREDHISKETLKSSARNLFISNPGLLHSRGKAKGFPPSASKEVI